MSKKWNENGEKGSADERKKQGRSDDEVQEQGIRKPNRLEDIKGSMQGVSAREKVLLPEIGSWRRRKKRFMSKYSYLLPHFFHFLESELTDRTSQKGPPSSLNCRSSGDTEMHFVTSLWKVLGGER